MGVSVGPVPEERADEYLRTMGGAFGFDSTEEDLNRFSEIFEWDRARAAYDEDEMVGTIGSLSLDMTVPGASLPCGGTTVVTVLPTHRRRGVLRAMMDAHFGDVQERGEPIAALWASDSGIYGRFGYGIAAREAELDISRDHSSFHRLAAPPAPVRLITKEEAARRVPGFYDSVRLEHPGFFARSPSWWTARRLSDRPSDRQGATAYRFAVTERDGSITGFVQYRYKEEWVDRHAAGEIRIRELLGTDPESWSGLWRFVLDHDLTGRIKAPHRSPADPVFDLLAAPRRARAEVSDSLWVRVMDVAAALEGRRYSAPVRTVLQVHDPIDAATTRWRLDLGPDGAEVTSTADEPEVVADLEDLGACFMGWSRFGGLAAVGRVEGDERKLRQMDLAFGWHPGPWSSEVF